MFALIPARSGSVRVPNKNIFTVNNHPMLSYSIASAINSNIFDEVIVCTDSQKYAEIARSYGATVPSIRPSNISKSQSPDRDWVHWLFSLDKYSDFNDSFAFILRPTNPFRTSTTIKRAWDQFSSSGADTLRAVRKVVEHPGKMWIPQGNNIIPLLPFSLDSVPFHSNQTAALFNAFIQDASLEIFSLHNFRKSGSITGSSICPFFAEGYEGFDINVPEDIELMLKLLNSSNPPSMEIPRLISSSNP